jgi:Glu-tRNA(Gln) amidotransferase subunit E-like FAD-binding protein
VPQGISVAKRKFEVSGTEDLDTVHHLCTDEFERADEIAATVREDLERRGSGGRQVRLTPAL